MDPIARGPKCDCPPDTCGNFTEPDSDCIYRLSGDVATAHCETCNPGSDAQTWHQDGECLKCPTN